MENELNSTLRQTRITDLSVEPFHSVPEKQSNLRRYKNGELYNLDCVDFLRQIDSGSVGTVFADPPYNIKKADWDNLGSADEYIAWSMRWIKESARILKETGTLYICGFSEILADLKYPCSKLFKKCNCLFFLDIICFHDSFPNLFPCLLCCRNTKQATCIF